MICAQLGSSTSSLSHFPPLLSTSATRSGVREGLREVAITVCPCDWTARARVRPKPEEQPVMSHVSGLLGIVNVIDMLVVLNFRGSFQASFTGLSFVLSK